MDHNRLKIYGIQYFLVLMIVFYIAVSARWCAHAPCNQSINQWHVMKDWGVRLVQDSVRHVHAAQVLLLRVLLLLRHWQRHRVSVIVSVM